MSVNPSPFGPKPQLELASGAPAVGNQLFFYVAGSVNTKQTTYTDSTGGSANPNPIVLNALGQPANEIWFTAGQAYKVVFAPSTDTDPPTSPIWTIDNLRGINDSSTSVDQWTQSGVTPTYVSASQFTVPGDQTSYFQVGRRVKATVTAGTVYGTISASAYAALTTVTVIFENSGALDAGLSAVSYGIVTDANDSLPRGTSRGKEIDVATNATANIFAAGSENIRLTGTTTVTAFDTANAGITRKCRSQSAFVLTYNVTSMICPGSANISVAPGDTFEVVSLGSGNSLIVNYQKADGTPVASIGIPVRQTVLQGPVDTSGLPTFLPATVASLIMSTQNVSTGLSALVVTAANGANANGAVNAVGQSTANLTWPACTGSATNYLPLLVNANGTLTPQTPVTLAPIYQFGGTPAITAGQYTFNIQQMTMYLGNGATAPAVNHVIVGECVCTTTIISSVAYAYQGRYDSGYAALPAASTATSKNHNIGTDRVRAKLRIVCVTAELGYSIGDVVAEISGYNGTYSNPQAVWNDKKSIGFMPDAAAVWIKIPAKTGSGSVVAITLANWNYKLLSEREF